MKWNKEERREVQERICVIGDRRELMFRNMHRIREETKTNDKQVKIVDTVNNSSCPSMSLHELSLLWYKLQTLQCASLIASMAWMLIAIDKGEKPYITKGMLLSAQNKTRHK